MITRLRAFHGTRASRVDSIVGSGLRPSIDSDEWLGSGTYFFIEGLNDPWTSAFEWARVEAWDKKSRRFSENEIGVIEYAVELNDDHLFDLRQYDDAKEFHRTRRSWLRRHVPRRSTHRARPAETTYDTDLLNQFKHDQSVAAMIADFHIQLTVRERHFRVESRIPNVSVLCVTHPLVPPTRIEVVKVDVLPQGSVLESEMSDDQ